MSILDTMRRYNNLIAFRYAMCNAFYATRYYMADYTAAAKRGGERVSTLDYLLSRKVTK